MKKIFYILTVISFNLIYSQNSDEILKSDLERLKINFLNKQFVSYSDYIYPEVVNSYGSKEKMINSLTIEIENMEKEGFFILDIDYKNFSTPIYENKETQISIVQSILLQTPNGKVEYEYSLIAISNNNGQYWTFIDTFEKKKKRLWINSLI